MNVLQQEPEKYRGTYSRPTQTGGEYFTIPTSERTDVCTFQSIKANVWNCEVSSVAFVASVVQVSLNHNQLIVAANTVISIGQFNAYLHPDLALIPPAAQIPLGSLLHSAISLYARGLKSILALRTRRTWGRNTLW